MSTIFKFTPKESFNSKEMMEGLSGQKDVQTFLQMNTGEEVTVEMKLSNKLSKKNQLFAFYHRVVLSVAAKCFENDGWTGMDKVKADYMLKAECGKEIMINDQTGEEQVYLLDKSRLNHKELYAYVCRCINFLEMERGYTVPDSSSWLLEKTTGLSGFKKI